MTVLPRPGLPDGLIAFVKQDCPTCTLVEPVLQELEAAGKLVAVYTQDDTSFPAVDNRIDDTSLEFSFRHDIETVPTLMNVVDGAESDRIVGWSRDMWAGFTGVDSLGLDAGITDFSPGCGSMSVDPDLRAGLEARYGSGFVRSDRTVGESGSEAPMASKIPRSPKATPTPATMPMAEARTPITIASPWT